MTKTIHLSELFCEPQLFAQGARAGEFIFLAQDGRAASGAVDGDIGRQTRRALDNLAVSLKSENLSLNNLVSLTVFLPNYADAPAITAILRDRLLDKNAFPAVTLVGVCDLEANCGVRIDAIATSQSDCETINIPGLPLPVGAVSHGARAGDLFFLSGMDASASRGTIAAPTTIQIQTKEVLARIRNILGTKQLGLGNLCRTFMFMPGTQYRPGYGEARKRVYEGIFKEDEFPPNSGIYIRSLGENILLRSVAIAYRGKIEIVTSPKVRKAPGSFSQSVRVGDWLFLAGQDAVGFNREVKAENSLAGQTEATLEHTKDIVEAAGGSLDDLVKTTVYLTEGTDRAEFAEAYRNFFVTHSRNQVMPTGLTVVVQELSPRCLVEIDSVAYLRRAR
jgi:2-iminobutanoate/2-iminopropanoate deaminase